MKTKIFLLSSAIALIGASAQAAVVTGDIVGISEVEIRTNLEREGYTVQQIAIEGDEIEVDALYEGAATEIEISSVSGAVLEVEIDLEADDQDDD